MKQLPGDTTSGTDPVAFAIAFVTAMRKERGLSQIPSLRTTVAIPRLLTARWFRLRALAPRDYVDAAVLCSPPEDQVIAARVARELLFPKQPDEPVAVAVAAEAAAPAPAAAPPPMIAAANPVSSILDDLASLDIDLDALGSLGDVDALLDQAEKGTFRSFDLYESLHQSADAGDRALGALLEKFGGAAELEAQSVLTKERAVDFARSHLRARIGELSPDEIVHGADAGFGSLLVAEVDKPWELAGALAGTRDLGRLGDVMKDVLAHGSARDIGRTLKFLSPFAGAVTGSEFSAFRRSGLERARDLADHAELLEGLGSWVAPAPDLVKRSAVENVTRALHAAKWIDRAFGHDLRATVFDHWADAQIVPPDLDTLLDLVVPSKRWESLVDGAYGPFLVQLVSDSSVGDA